MIKEISIYPEISEKYGYLKRCFKHIGFYAFRTINIASKRRSTCWIVIRPENKCEGF